MLNRATKQLSSGSPAREHNSLQQNSTNKKMTRVSSSNGFLLLTIAVAVNFMIVSTLFVNKEHRNTASATDGQWTPLLDARSSSEQRKEMQRLPSSTKEYASQSSKLNETVTTNSVGVQGNTKTLINLTLQELSLSSPTIKNRVTKRSTGTTVSLSQQHMSFVPYYLMGKTKYKRQKFHRKKTFQRIEAEEAKLINPSQKVWVLPDPVKLPTRNHESIILEYEARERASDEVVDKQVLVNVLGRHSRGVQWMDLQTGEQRSIETNGTDPDQRPLNDLNHVASVLVDSLESDANGRRRKEVWLPCGFHNDRVGKELSSNYARIVDLETMKVRTGPKLPYSGGACGAAPIEAIPGEPPLVCAFGGTNGNHDTGTSDQLFCRHIVKI